MKPRLTLPTFILALFAATAFAQSTTDYASVLAAADWGWQNRGGVEYGKASFANLYGQPQTVSIARYSETEMATMLYVKEQSSQGTGSLAYEAGATAAINGSYFNMTTMTSTTAIWVGGTELATTTSDEFARCNGILLFKDGIFSIENYSSSTTHSRLGYWGRNNDALVAAGPIIRRNGRSVNANVGGEGFYSEHPRTMLGKCADGTVYMVVMEGRLDGAAGFTTANMVSLAEDLGMTDAINLDGGGSSTLWVAGAGVINRPSGGAVRNVPNIIMATPRTTDDDMTVDGIKYMITGNNTVAVTYPNEQQPSATNKSAYTGEVNVPATVTIGGKVYNVTAVGDYAFHCADITALSLPEGITSLGYKAIYQTQLTEIAVPNSVTLMDYEALGYNKSLAKITFGENIAANTWGDKLCIYGGKKYEVYMNCDAVPKLRSYTFDFTGANVHVRPTMYQAFCDDAAWSSYDIIGDLWKEYTYSDLQQVLSDYSPLVPSGDAVGTDPGCYSESSVKAMSDAIAEAQALDETATLEQLNKAISGILTSHESLYCYPLHEGYYYIESVSAPGYVLQGDADNANRDGLKVVELAEAETVPYFKLTRKNGNWIMQCAGNGMYVGTAIGGNGNAKPVSLTADAKFEQVITWAGGGRFKIQGSSTYPYSYVAGRLRTYNYPAGGSFEVRQMWRLHPATAGMFGMDYDLENGRVRGFVHDFEYTESDASKVNDYNVSPPERRDWPLPVEVWWNRRADADGQQIAWSESPDLADAQTRSVPAESASSEIYNLIPGRTYYCRVTATKTSEPENSAQWTMQDGQWQTVLADFAFTTAGRIRHLKAEGTANVRDLGGWPTASGKQVSYGKIFRGGEWNGGHELEPEGIEALRQAGIKAELDLRSDSEAKSITSSVLGSGVAYRRTALGQTASHMKGITDSKSTYKTALQYVLTCVKNDRPVYFHCAIGRDRTGTLAFLLEGVLGMSKSDIYKDYELTNFSFWNTPCSKGQLDEMFAAVEAMEGETLEQKFRTYLTSYFGFTQSAIDEFRDKMLVRGESGDGIQPPSVSPQGEGTVHLPSRGGWEGSYDLQGRKVLTGCPPSSGLPRGVYIMNGKKILY